MTESRRVQALVADTTPVERSPEELEAMVVVDLPEREALSVAFPLAGPLSLGGIARGTEAVADSVDDTVLDPTA